MALVKCKECGAAISQTADTCPKCGKKQRMSVMEKFLTMAMIFIALYILLRQYAQYLMAQNM